MNFEGLFTNLDDISVSKQPLGTGSFGTAYMGKDKKTNKNLVVKIINSADRFNGNDQMMFLRDIYSLKNLSHQGIVEFIGISFQSIHDPKVFQPTVVTEYISNGSLKDMLEKLKRKNKSLDPTQKYKLLLSIIDAMRYLHKNDVVHRDLKPTNIIMDDELNPHLSDYGVSRCFAKVITQAIKDTMTKTNEFKDLVYMAPEMLNGENRFDPSVDIYSFAMIAYEILTGKHPFEDYGDSISPIALSIKIASGLRPELDDDHLNSKMQELLSNCWNKTVAYRPSFEEIFTFLSSDFSYIDDVDENAIKEFLNSIINKSTIDRHQKTIFNTSPEELQLINQQLAEKIKKAKNDCFNIVQTIQPTPEQIDETGHYQIPFLIFLIEMPFFKHVSQVMQDLLIILLHSIQILITKSKIFLLLFLYNFI